LGFERKIKEVSMEEFKEMFEKLLKNAAKEEMQEVIENLNNVNEENEKEMKFILDEILKGGK